MLGLEVSEDYFYFYFSSRPCEQFLVELVERLAISVQWGFEPQ